MATSSVVRRADRSLAPESTIDPGLCATASSLRRLVAQRVVDAFFDQLEPLVDALRAPVVLVFHPALRLRFLGREGGLLGRRRRRRWRRWLPGRRSRRRCGGRHFGG